MQVRMWILALTLVFFAAGAPADSLTGTSLEARTDDRVAKFVSDQDDSEFEKHLETLWQAGGSPYVHSALERLTARILGPDDGDRARKMSDALPPAGVNGFQAPPFPNEVRLFWLLGSLIENPRMASPALQISWHLQLDGRVSNRWPSETTYTYESKDSLEFLSHSGFLADLDAFGTLPSPTRLLVSEYRGTLLGAVVLILRHELHEVDLPPYQQLLEKTPTFGGKVFLAAFRRDEPALRQLLRENRDAIAAWPEGRQLELARFFREELAVDRLDPTLEEVLSRSARAQWGEAQKVMIRPEWEYQAGDRLASIATADPAFARTVVRAAYEGSQAFQQKKFPAESMLQEIARYMEPRLALRFQLELMTGPELAMWDLSKIQWSRWALL